MQIAYINKGKIKAKSSTDKMLEQAYLKDIRLCYTKRRKSLDDLGISETEFVNGMKEIFRLKEGIFND